MRSSLSPPTSASTLSSSFNGGGGGNSTDNTTTATDKAVKRKDEWATWQPIPTGLELVSTVERCGLGLEDWENMLSEPKQEQSLFRCIAGDADESFGLRQLLQCGNNPTDFDGNGVGGLGIADHRPVFEGMDGIWGTNLTCTGISLLPALPPGIGFHHNLQHQTESSEKKPQILNPQALMNQQQSQVSGNQNPNFSVPMPFSRQESHLLRPQSKRHNSGGIDSMPQAIPQLPIQDPGSELLLQFLHPHLHQKPMVIKKEEIGGQQQQQHHQHAMLDQLYKAAELVGSGNFSQAQGILALLNQQLSPIGKPLHRTAFCFKEALQLLLLTNGNPVSTLPPRSPTPFDVIFRMGTSTE